MLFYQSFFFGFLSIQSELTNIAQSHSITDGERGKQRHNLYSGLQKKI